jgi:cytochrome c peroxidase
MAFDKRYSCRIALALTLLLNVFAPHRTMGATPGDRIQAQDPVVQDPVVQDSTVQDSINNKVQQAPPPSGLTIAVLDAMSRLPGGLSSLPSPPIPRQNPQTRSKIDLGKTLFFDVALSRDRSLSCATCHDPGMAYSDGRARAIGITHTMLRRRSPSLLNSAYNATQFWDGRAQSLEDQALIPVLSMSEMGMQSRRALLARLQSMPEYPRRFRQAFGRAVNLLDMERAIAAFERTLISADSAFDRYALGDRQALTNQEKRGLILFIGKASCSQCHNGPNFTDNKFHSLGSLSKSSEKLVSNANEFDLGHFAVSNKAVDRYAFKTPGLRSATGQSHFMHDGSLATLEQVIDFYDEGGGQGPKSKLLFKLHLTAEEKENLLAFLRSLR